MGKQWKQWQTLFSWAPKSLQMVTAAMKLKKHLFLGRKAMTNLDSTLKSRDITLLTTVHLVKGMVFPVVTYGCESWTIKKAECWRIDALNCGIGGDSWESLDCKDIQPVHTKGNQSWIFIGRTDAEAETSTLWPHDAKNWLPEKRPWCWERLKAVGEGDGKGWDGWMESSTRWTWVCTSSGSWWWIGKPGVLQSMVSQSQTGLSDWT